MPSTMSAFRLVTTVVELTANGAVPVATVEMNRVPVTVDALYNVLEKFPVLAYNPNHLAAVVPRFSLFVAKSNGLNADVFRTTDFVSSLLYFKDILLPSPVVVIVILAAATILGPTPVMLPLTFAVPLKLCPQRVRAVCNLVADATLLEVRATVPVAAGKVKV